MRAGRIRIKEKPQEGVLKSKGKIVYHYSFDRDYCKTRTINEGVSLSNWIEPEVIFTEGINYDSFCSYVLLLLGVKI